MQLNSHDFRPTENHPAEIAITMPFALFRRRFIAFAAAAVGLATALLMVPADKCQGILKAGGGEQAIFVAPQCVVATVLA